MAGTRQRKLWAGFWFLLAIVLTPGCDLGSIAYFLSGGGEPKLEAEMPLVPPEKKKEARVVLLVYSGLDTRPEFVTVDRELSGLLTRHLHDGCQENKQKIDIISPTKIQEFKNNHPDWHSMKLEEVGRRFNADYVAFFEIESMSRYEKGSANQLYRGRAEIAVTLVDMHKPGEDPIEKHFTREYPSARGPVAVDDSNPRDFYLKFLNFVAQRLSWYFTAHPFSDEV